MFPTLSASAQTVNVTLCVKVLVQLQADWLSPKYQQQMITKMEKLFFNIVLNICASMCRCFHSLMFILMRSQIWNDEGGKLGARKEGDEKTEGQAKPGLH